MKFLKCLHSWPRGFRAPFRSRRSAAGGLPGGAELRGPPAAFRAGDGGRRPRAARASAAGSGGGRTWFVSRRRDVLQCTMATHQILLRGAAQCCLLQAAMHLVDAVSSSLAALRLAGGQAGSRGQGSGRRQVTLSRLGVPRPAWGRRAVPEASAPPPHAPGVWDPQGRPGHRVCARSGLHPVTSAPSGDLTSGARGLWAASLQRLATAGPRRAGPALTRGPGRHAVSASAAQKPPPSERRGRGPVRLTRAGTGRERRPRRLSSAHLPPRAQGLRGLAGRAPYLRLREAIVISYVMFLFLLFSQGCLISKILTLILRKIDLCSL